MNITNLSFFNNKVSNNYSISTNINHKYNPLFGTSNKNEVDKFVRRVNSKNLYPNLPELNNFRELGIEYEIDKKDNKIILDKYKTDKKLLEKNNINEKKLLENVKNVKGTLNLTESELESLPSLEEVGTLVINYTDNLKTLPNLKKAKNIRAFNSALESLPSLEEVKTLDITKNSSLKSLPKLRKADFLLASESVLESAQALKKVEGILNISHTNNIKTLPKLITAGKIVANNSSLESLPAIKKVTGDLDLRNCPKLHYINPNLKIDGKLNY